jgi:hypothetical protein
LGGRPKLPTKSEARRAVLDELVGPALRSLKAHLGTGNADAWRSALRILELQFGLVAALGEIAALDNASRRYYSGASIEREDCGEGGAL